MDNSILLQDWFMANTVSEDMLWKKPSEQQIIFVRNNLSVLITGKLNNAFVISTHTSKSIKLPVYSLKCTDLEIILRNNFYNWKISVISAKPIDVNFSGLFHTCPPIDPDYTGDPLHSVYFEGFPEELIFGYYDNSDHKKWSAEISRDYSLWTALFLIMRSLGKIEPFRWALSKQGSD